MVYRLADKSLDILEHLARRGSVWPEACGAAIKDLQTQLTRKSSQMIGNGGIPRAERSIPSPYENAADTSPHVVAHTPTQAPVSTLEEPAQEYGIAHTIPAHRSGARMATTRPASREPYSFEHASVPVDTGFNVQTNDQNADIPPLGDLSHNDLMLDRSFQLSSYHDDQDHFAGFDIPFWLGQDQYSGMINEWS